MKSESPEVADLSLMSDVRKLGEQVSIEFTAGPTDGMRTVVFESDLYYLYFTRWSSEVVSSPGFVLDKVIHGLLNNAGTFAGDYTGQRKETPEGNEYSFLGGQASALSVRHL